MSNNLPKLGLTLKDLESSTTQNQSGGVTYYQLDGTNTVQLADGTLCKIFVNKRPPAEEYATLPDGRQVKMPWESKISLSVVKASPPVVTKAPAAAPAPAGAKRGKTFDPAKPAPKPAAPSVEERMTNIETVLAMLAQKLA